MRRPQRLFGLIQSTRIWRFRTVFSYVYKELIRLENCILEQRTVLEMGCNVRVGSERLLVSGGSESDLLDFLSFAEVLEVLAIVGNFDAASVSKYDDDLVLGSYCLF